ncbi:glycosyltransferase family 2 protein [Hydrogenophaga soli]
MSLSVSIVSHGHGPHVRVLLSLLAQADATPLRRVWLTLNVPEPGLLALQGLPWPFDLRVVGNAAPLGFGANHNQAFFFEQSEADPAVFFAVLNPDLTWQVDPFPMLLAAAQQPFAGCAYPMQLDPQGRVQDHRRLLPSPWSLWRRYLVRQDSSAQGLTSPDWVNAALLVFPSAVYAALGGFDVGYFMYCEDVDICLRLQLAGRRLIDAHQAQVVHDAHRSSRRNVRHLYWHVRSLLRLWSSASYRQYRAKSASVVTING